MHARHERLPASRIAVTELEIRSHLQKVEAQENEQKASQKPRENLERQSASVQALYDLGIIDLFIDTATALRKLYPDAIVLHTNPAEDEQKVKAGLYWNFVQDTSEGITCIYNDYSWLNTELTAGREYEDSVRFARGTKDIRVSDGQINVYELFVDEPDFYNKADNAIAEALLQTKIPGYERLCRPQMPSKGIGKLAKRISGSRDAVVRVF